MPTLASSSLFAVTTGLPCFSAVVISSRAGSMPPIVSTTRSMVGSLTTAYVSRVSTPSGSATSRGRLRLRTATAPISSRTPVRAAMTDLLAGDELDEGAADVAAAEDADADSAMGLGHGSRG